MKKIFILIAFLVLSSLTFAQQGTKINSTAPYFQKNVRVNDTLGVNKCIILNGDTITNFGSAGPESDPIWNFEKSLYPVFSDTINKLATKYDIANLTPIDTTNLSDSLRIAFEAIDLKLNKTDTTSLSNRIDLKVSLSDSVSSYVTPTSLLTYSYATTSQVGAKADTANVPLLNTKNVFTKANEFTSTIKLTNASTITSADSMLVIDGGIIKKEVIVDLTNSTIPRATIDTLTINENTTVFGGETLYVSKQSMIDDSSIILPTATCGYGDIVVGDGTTWVRFFWTTAGVVTLLDNSADVDDADTDTFFCIFDSGTTITIKNRLGSTKNVRFNLHYSTN